MGKTKFDKILLSVPIIIAVILSYYNRHFYFDDSLIYARYVKNFLDFGQLVYNKNEFFNGLTSPLFTYLSILVSLLFKDVVLSITILSGLFLVSSIFIFQKLFYENFNNVLIPVLGSLLILSAYITYQVFGMETFLFIFLIGLSVHLYLKKNYFFLLICLALVILTRSEGVFLALSIIYYHYKNKENTPDIKYFILPTILMLTHFSFNYFYFGKLLPETGTAKIYQGMSGLWGKNFPLFLAQYQFIISTTFAGNYLQFGIITLISLLGMISNFHKKITKILFYFGVILLLFYVLLNIPNYHWYNMPFIVIIFYYFFVGLISIYKYFNKISVKLKYISIFIILSLSTYVFYNNFSKLTFDFPEHSYVNIGKWMKENLPEKSSVATVEIGIIGYYSELKIIDILGLVTPNNAYYIGTRQFNKWLDDYQPDYILAHDPLWGHEITLKNSKFINNYKIYNKFQYPGYILHAKNTLNINRKFLSSLNYNYYDILEYNDYNEINSETYNGKTIIFSHIGTSFKVPEKILKKIDSNNIKFIYALKNEALEVGKPAGACFRIYASSDKDSLIWERCINPMDNHGDRGEQYDSLQFIKNINEYLFEVTTREGHNDNWGWTYWRLY